MLSEFTLYEHPLKRRAIVPYLTFSSEIQFRIRSHLISIFNIQQVETVGDKYMAVSGLPDNCENHAVCIARLALDMNEMAESVKMDEEPVVSCSVLSTFCHLIAKVAMTVFGTIECHKFSPKKCSLATFC